MRLRPEVQALPRPLRVSWTAEIEDAERRLRAASLAGDMAALDALLADDLVFTNQLGHVLDKQADLELHRSGALKIASLSFSDYEFATLGDDLALATLRADAQGLAGGQPFDAALRFTRLWRRDASGWRVKAAHCSQIV